MSVAAPSAVAEALLWLVSATAPVQFRTLSPRNIICSVSTTCSRDVVPQDLMDAAGPTKTFGRCSSPCRSEQALKQRMEVVTTPKTPSPTAFQPYTPCTNRKTESRQASGSSAHLVQHQPGVGTAQVPLHPVVQLVIDHARRRRRLEAALVRDGPAWRRRGASGAGAAVIHSPMHPRCQGHSTRPPAHVSHRTRWYLNSRHT